MKNLILIALISCFTASAAEMGSTNHIVLVSGTGTNKVLLNHIIESTRKRVMNAFSLTKLDDYKETTLVFQDKPLVQVIYFKSATDNGFRYEYRIENGKATLLKAEEGVIPDPEGSVAVTADHVASNNTPVEMKLADVPEPVRRVINTELSNGPLKKVERVVHNRHQIYQASFQQKDGTEKVIYLNADGTYVKDK